eukprot:7025762-Alexandrium_andersonii.AAC.1
MSCSNQPCDARTARIGWQLQWAGLHLTLLLRPPPNIRQQTYGRCAQFATVSSAFKRFRPFLFNAFKQLLALSNGFQAVSKTLQGSISPRPRQTRTSGNCPKLLETIANCAQREDVFAAAH